MKKYLKGIALGLTGFLLLGGIALAAIASPDTQTINTIEAFRGVLNTDDQLYLVTFSLDYTSNPTDSAQVNFLFRLLDNGVEIASVAPNPFNDSGYDDGIISFYFAAGDVNIPVWQTANLEVVFTGNPALDWGGNPPVVTNNVIDSFTDGVQTLPARIRFLGVALETKWGLDLIELISGALVLTSSGEIYFEAVITNLRIMAPSIFISTTVQPDFVEREFSLTYATTAEDRWVGDPILDVTAAADELNMSRLWMNSLIWLGVSVAIMILLVRMLKRVRPAAFIFGAMLIIGSFSGFMTFVGGIFVGVIGALAIVYTLFYRSSP